MLKNPGAVVTPRMQEVLDGTLLGDGCITRTVYNGFYYRALHGKKQREYLWWKYFELRNLCGSAPHIRKADGATGFFTRQHPYLTELKYVWYPGLEHKKVPVDIESRLTPLALALWYCDDGSLRTHNMGKPGALLCSEGFTGEGNELLRAALFNRYQIQTSLHESGTGGKRINMLTGTIGKFWETIAPHIPVSMDYKLPIDARCND